MTHHISRGITALAILLGLVIPVAAQRRPMTEKDLFSFVWIADPQISPDGSQVAFVRVTVDEKKDSYDTALWLAKTDGSEPPRAITSGVRDTSPRWSPDGRRLAFVRSVEKDGGLSRRRFTSCRCREASRGPSPTSRAARATLSGRPTVRPSPSPRPHGPQT